MKPKATFTVTLTIAGGDTWVTVQKNGRRFYTERLDKVLKVPNAIYDLACLADAGDEAGLKAILSTCAEIRS